MIEMDDIGAKKNVFIIGATNRPGKLMVAFFADLIFLSQLILILKNYN